MIDVVLRLREARRRAGLTQQQLADLSGVGSRTISTFECGGRRATGMSVEQLAKLVSAMGMTLEEFFSEDFERQITDTAIDERKKVRSVVAGLLALDDVRQERLVRTFVNAIALARQSEARGRRLA